MKAVRMPSMGVLIQQSQQDRIHLAKKSKAPSILKKCFVYNDRFLLGFPHGKYLYENGTY